MLEKSIDFLSPTVSILKKSLKTAVTSFTVELTKTIQNCIVPLFWKEE